MIETSLQSKFFRTRTVRWMMTQKFKALCVRRSGFLIAPLKNPFASLQISLRHLSQTLLLVGLVLIQVREGVVVQHVIDAARFEQPGHHLGVGAQVVQPA